MIYKEKQRFSRPLLWFPLIISGTVVNGIFGIACYKQIILGQQFGNHPLSNTALIIAGSLVLLIFILLSLLLGLGNLTTLIDENEINLRFFPFHVSFKKYPWSAVERVEIVSYHPVADFGGWGIRSGKKGKAYNVSGNKGLDIYFKNGKRLLIGTQNHIALTDFLNKIKADNFHSC